MTTNFNLNPYYDDYDEDKNFYRVLFKPGMAVQARELTQLQTILQNQIEKFGKHIFKEGTIVLGGSYNIDAKVNYVKINDIDIDGDEVIDIEQYIGQTIVGATTGVEAQVFNATDGRENTDVTKTLFVGYTSSGTDGETYTFAPGEVLNSLLYRPTVIDSANSVGTASIFTIQDGTLFVKNHFVNFNKQSIILDKYSSNPTLKICFDISEEIVDYSEDTSLLDPALGSYNYSAPGADRFKINVTLKTIDIDTEPDENTVELLIIRDGVIEKNYIKTSYAMLADEFARRTSDESGDYYVKGLDVTIREHLNNGSNLGYLTQEAGGNTSLLAVGIQPGKAYVKGYEVQTLVTNYIPIEKGLDYDTISGQIITARKGTYIRCDELSGSFDLTSPIPVSFYDQPQNSISEYEFSSDTPTGNVIGSARITGIDYSSGYQSSPYSQYLVYLSDIKMNTGKAVSSIKSLAGEQLGTYSANIRADSVLVNDTYTVIEDLSTACLIYNTGSSSVKSIVGDNDVSDTSFIYKKNFPATIAEVGTFSITNPDSAEMFPFTEGTLSDEEKREILLTVCENVSVPLSGTVSISTANSEVYGTDTYFEFLNVGDKVKFGNDSNLYFVGEITSNTKMILYEIPATTATGLTISKEYRKGDVIDLTGKGNTGNERSVSVLGGDDDTLNFNLQELYTTTIPVSVLVNVGKSSATAAKKNLRDGRYVIIDCETLGSTTGPFYLGVSDLYKIESIRHDTSAFTSNTQGTLVTDFFAVNKGQTEESYNTAFIVPRGASLTSSSKLLVKLSYFSPDYSQGQGYFSVDSYPIDDTVVSSDTITTAEIPIFKSPRTGIEYDLRNCLDFRPVKTNTAADAAILEDATTNPEISDTFVIGCKILDPNSLITFDFTEYLGRKDIVCVDKNGTFSVARGIPSSMPITPSVSPDVMSLSVIHIAPYPSLATSYASILNRKDLEVFSRKVANKRYTMRDIGALNRRIENLEYYSSLNMLEKDATDALILDEDGLDRFKNGIFVDNFANHSLGAEYNIDYRIVVDPIEGVIRPLFDMESIPYKVNSLGGVTQKGNLILRQYTETPLLSQPFATTNRNVETSVFRFIGNLDITPPCDFWIDTQQTSRYVDQTIGDASLVGSTYTTYGAWQTASSGVTVYKIYNNKTNELIFQTTDGVYAGQQAALLSSGQKVKQNTVGWKGDRIEVRVEGVNPSSVSTRPASSVTYSKELVSTVSDNKVTDVSLQTFIRPQILDVKGTGLKPNTRFYVFFDGEKMSDYCSQSNQTFTLFGVEGEKIMSDENGNIYFKLRLPATGKRFYTGTKTLRISDNITNSKDNETTYAEEDFVAQGLFQQKTNTILSTYNIVEKEQNWTDTIINPGTITVRIFEETCMAYSFYVAVDPTAEGIFLTSVDLYFAAKHPKYGFWVEIRAMDSGGGITRTQVPYSRVNVKSSDVVINANSEKALTATKITFNCPIFLYNNTQYAFVIHTEGINDGYYYWVAKLGEKNIANNQYFNARKLTGTLFTTNNNLNWDIVPDTDLKITFNRAKFVKGSGDVNMGNIPIEAFELTAHNDPFNIYGEIISAGDRLTISGGSIDVGDFLKGANTGANGKVLSVSGLIYRTDNVSFDSGEDVEVYDSNNVTKGITRTIGTITTPTGILRKYKRTHDQKYILELSNSTGGFVVGDKIVGLSSGDEDYIYAIGNTKFSTMDFEPSKITFNDTNITYYADITSNSTNVLSRHNINIDDNTTFNDEKVILSHSIYPKSSSNVIMRLETNSEFVSPVLDINKFHSIYVHNIINNDITGEHDVAYGGNAINKYISKIITLAEGQDAEDIIVRLSTYKPATTGVHVYIKIRNNEDIDSFEDKNWIKMVSEDDDVYSSISDDSDYFEISYNFPTSVMDSETGIVKYTNSEGNIFLTYIQFQIKIVLVGTNSAIVPKVGDLRVVALQK